MSYLSIQNNNFNNINQHESYLTTNNTNNIHMADDTRMDESTSDNNNQVNDDGKNVNEVWSKYNFKPNKIPVEQTDYSKMSWGSNVTYAPEVPVKQEQPDEAMAPRTEPYEEEHAEEERNAKKTGEKDDSPSHHARRPMNAFLIFCKKHRPVVRVKYPNLENRGVTKILGEWWAQLDNNEKQPYTDLAKKYKDAFLHANPNFKWYKLPAPPLRTLSTRPLQQKTSTPHYSPSIVDTPTSNHNHQQLTPSLSTSEFTPGKLADESQLGSLTSLMNNNYSTSKENSDCFDNKEDNNNESVGYEDANTSPTVFTEPVTPMKPVKKENNCESQNVECVKRNILDGSSAGMDDLTHQDLVNQVVDSCFIKQEDDESSLNGVRKSDRSCKGKRYEKFMVENKLYGHKKEPKLTQQRSKYETRMELNQTCDTPKMDLHNTIRRLAERTNVKVEIHDEPKPDKITLDVKRERTISENSDADRTATNDFNLDLKISRLPSLSYDTFIARKRENKKRKNRSKAEPSSFEQSKVHKADKEQPIGSKKRKNKSSITHLNNVDCKSHNDLSGLATLAEVAAITEKM